MQLQQLLKRELLFLHLPIYIAADSTNTSASIASPINLVLFSLLILLFYFRLRPSPPSTLPKGPAPVVFRKATLGQMSIPRLMAGLN